MKTNMIVFPFVWLLAGLLVHVSIAEEVDITTTSAPASTSAVDVLAIWDLDKSCDDEAQSMKSAMENVLEIVTATHKALVFLSASMPDPRKDPDGSLRYKTVHKICEAMLGFKPQKEPPYLAQVLDFFENMKTKMLATSDFEHGYSGQLKKRGIKPKIMCGDEVGADTWTWKPRDDLNEHHEFHKYKFYAGAWVHDHRYFFQEHQLEGPKICQPEKHAEAFLNHDLIVFCDKVFSRDYKSRKWPRELRNSGVNEYQSLNDLRNTLPLTMLHELTHWFDGWVKITDPSQRQRPDILDQTALYRDGRPIWKDARGVPYNEDEEPDWTEAFNAGWTRQLAYGVSHVINLAQTAGKRVTKYCGPEKAIKNADSLTFFALAVYLDNWDWSRGEARIPGKKKEPSTGEKRPNPPT